jgi:hypothetical protein
MNKELIMSVLKITQDDLNLNKNKQISESQKNRKKVHFY